MTSHPARTAGNRGERGQALLLFVGTFTVIIVIAAVVIDFGLWMAERRSLQRAADLAAAAGALELPDSDHVAEEKAREWARYNGFVEGVTVELLCKNTLGSPPAGICTNTNLPGGGPSTCTAGNGCDSLRVTISKPSSQLFTSMLGIAGIDVGATASAGVTFGGGSGGFAVGPQQTVILIDAQSLMGRLCSSYPDTCPIAVARDGANALVDLLLDGGGQRQVGYAPYTYCYEPPLHASNECVLDEGSASPRVVGLTSDGSALHTAIDATYAHRGAEANVCLPLLKAVEMFNAQPTSLPRAVVFLTDGDNRYDHTTYYDRIPYPPAPCRPSPYDESLPPRFGLCEWPVPEERVLDVLTKHVANSLEALGAEIYVVGLEVCGPDDGKTKFSPGYCNGIGDGAHDNTANQRLLKCIASSPEHYTSVSVAELPGTFQQIMLAFSKRSLLQ